LRAILEHIANENVSLAERSLFVKKEIKKEQEEEQDRRRNEKEKPPAPDEEEPMTAAATADLMGDRLHDNALWNEVPTNYFNVHAEWCVVNSPNSDTLVLVRPTLCDARVIDVGQYRNFVAMAMDMVNLFDADEVNTVRPPHTQLIADLHQYDGLDELQAEETNLMIEYDGVITYAIILGVAIRFYTIPASLEESKRFRPPNNVDVVQKSTGFLIPRMKQISLEISGDFVRHDPNVNPLSKAWDRRSKRVHDLYAKYEASVNRDGQAACLPQFESSVIVRGFLREGADEICHAAQLRNLSEFVQHFYPERDLPTNKQEYKDKVRDFADIVEDPWFNQEAGLPSIAALIKKIPVGDHVLLSRESDYDDPW
jgi:hypothetical protein